MRLRRTPASLPEISRSGLYAIDLPQSSALVASESPTLSCGVFAILCEGIREVQPCFHRGTNKYNRRQPAPILRKLGRHLRPLRCHPPASEPSASFPGAPSHPRSICAPLSYTCRSGRLWQFCSPPPIYIGRNTRSIYSAEQIGRAHV